jgi:hypothetical protein
MKRRTIFIGVLVLAVLAAVLLAPYAWRRVCEWAVGIHQRSTTKELAAWEREYGKVHTRAEAKRAIDMLDYVQRYYVPGPSYRSDEKTEAKLEAQRARTVRAIVAALSEFTGQDFGEDAETWREWLRKDQEGKPRVEGQGRPSD